MGRAHRSVARRALTAVRCACTWFVGAFLGLGAVGAGDVAIVLSQDLAPYRHAVQGVEEILGPTAHVFDLAIDPGGDDGVVRRLKSEGPKVVIAIGSRAAHVVTSRLPGMPTVFCMALGGDVTSLAGPRVTGVSVDVPAERQIATFREVIPGLSRIAVLYDPSNSGALVERARAVAAAQGVELLAEAVVHPEDVPTAFRRASRRANGIWLIPDSTVVSRESFEFVLREAAERRIPLMVFSEPMVRAGALVGLVPDATEVGRQAAELAVKLRDAPERRVPSIEAPRGLYLALNLKAAEHLGVSIPDDVMSRAGSHVYR